MATITTMKRGKAAPETTVSDGFIYRGVRINRAFKPTKRTVRIDAAMRKILRMKLAERASS